MSFRTITFSNRCKLQYSLNYLIYRGDEEKKILIDEISMIIIDNQQVSITSSLLTKLIEKKIRVIFCDEFHNPQFELQPYYSNYETYNKINIQFNFKKETKEAVWKEIIKKKIFFQSKVLSSLGLFEKCHKLEEYSYNVENNDVSNREGHAAKVYFNVLFGNDFSRSDDTDIINAKLNYGYSIILSQINRVVKSLGYLTELGIHHIGCTNPFNFSCDLIEPLRPFIDNIVIKELNKKEDFKVILRTVCSRKVFICNKETYLENAITIYIESVLKALKENDEKLISFVEYEL